MVCRTHRELCMIGRLGRAEHDLWLCIVVATVAVATVAVVAIAGAGGAAFRSSFRTRLLADGGPQFGLGLGRVRALLDVHSLTRSALFVFIDREMGARPARHAFSRVLTVGVSVPGENEKN